MDGLVPLISLILILITCVPEILTGNQGAGNQDQVVNIQYQYIITNGRMKTFTFPISIMDNQVGISLVVFTMGCGLRGSLREKCFARWGKSHYCMRLWI
ncbi:hypothetical protein KKF34_06720 [Myxococcota bacterium]|nr:hypothetical protein [Myxococcota bacterium]MBU1382701.1 hypothetical protein [Myxococcota bacterium]MBU1496553.1 hypothetical protein [Myxococcota bacterium]